MIATVITQKKLIDWAGIQVLKDAENLISRGLVLEAKYEPPMITGMVVVNNKPLATAMKVINDGTVESLCPCYTNKERGLICSHVIALALAIVKRNTDPLRETKYQEEQRRASRLQQINEADYIKRVSFGTPGALHASLRISLDENWQDQFMHNAVNVTCTAIVNEKSCPLDQLAKDVSFIFSKQDESLLYVIDDISQGPAKARITANKTDFLNIINLCHGKTIEWQSNQPITANEAKMKTLLNLDLDRETGELILIAHTELPFMTTGKFPFYMIAGKGGWIYGAGNLWPLENILPLPYHAIYEKPIIISRHDVPRFIHAEMENLSKILRVDSDITPDLFTFDPMQPQFSMVIQGSPASLAATLFARYNGIELVVCKPDSNELFGVPDPNDLMHYMTRNKPAEKKALAMLAKTGFAGEYGDQLTSIIGNREVLNFLGSYLPALRRLGWKVEIRGKVSAYFDTMKSATPVIHINDNEGGGNWFDVGFEFEDDTGASLSMSEIQTAIRKGEHYIRKNDNTYLIDSAAVDSIQDIFDDCSTTDSDTPGHFRMSNIYAPYVKSALESLDNIDIEDNQQWRTKAAQMNGTAKMEPVQLDPHMESILRPYQKDGINWLTHLNKNGFCGILADEMGLGKTIQALVWMQYCKNIGKLAGKPCLIICPTSLVENWAEESAKFTPSLNTLVFSGADRHSKFDQIKESDIVVTSYAILRRDLDKLSTIEFSLMLLDEAQHIKNKSTQNAIAAKTLKSASKLVLTGTPIENSVLDLWSIMDFLMPGYLGSHELFKSKYEAPIARGGLEADAAHTKLKRKLHPFLLRRLKVDVARELPPKIQKIATCSLTADQRLVYNQLIESSRRKIESMVAKQGFNKSRMEILVVLMRLRQTCCHLDLLKLPDLKPEFPSAKMDLFLELVDEAVDSGHRILVFSQFVGMLSIIRAELDKRNLSYCYLDGSTKERMKVVHTFNTQRDIPLFLISLKAGGTGLNLTGADMVIHFDPWWNPAVEDQATDRAYRIGQKRTVYSIKLITKGTVEEKVLEMQKRKKAVIDATIDSDEEIIQKMDWSDIQEILNI